MKQGSKNDQGKPPMDLLDRVALEEVARVLGHGAQKYGAFNWKQGLSQRRTLGAALRHVFKHLDGETKDPDSGLTHLGHAMCELMFAIRMLKDRPDLDDRYKDTEEPKEEECVCRQVGVPFGIVNGVDGTKCSTCGRVLD